MLKTNGKH